MTEEYFLDWRNRQGSGGRDSGVAHSLSEGGGDLGSHRTHAR